MCIYVYTHIFWAHGCSMGWASLRLPPRPRARPLGPPCPSPGQFAYAELTRAYAQLTRRIVLCSQRKGGNSHRRTAEGPGGGGAGAKGPGGPVSVEGNCRRVEYIIGQHIG